MRDLLIFFFVCMTVMACGSDDCEVYGTIKEAMNTNVLQVDRDNPIGLSDTIIEFAAVADTVCITTKETGWWLESVMVDTVKYVVSDENSLMSDDSVWSMGTYDWLSIKCSDREIILMATENYKLKRTFNLNFRLGDYVQELRGWQMPVVDGSWKDIIGLSPRNVVLEASGGTAIATIQSDFCWVGDITVDDEIYRLTLAERDACHDGSGFEKSIGWLTVRMNKREIEVEASPNPTGNERHFKVLLIQGDCYNILFGVQAGS